MVEEICHPEQTYVCLWSHGPASRRHLHFLVQPVTAELVAHHNGDRSEQLQARMLATGHHPARADIERFCTQARALFHPTRPAL